MHRIEPDLNDLPATGAILPGRDIPVIAIDMPIMYEDEGQEELGESSLHTGTCFGLHYGLKAYFANRPELCVTSDLDTYYHPVHSRAYFSADVMVARPFAKLSKWLDSYRIGEHGPAPLLIVEILSDRSDQQYDLTLKSRIYSELGVSEYLLVDPSGEFLATKLELRKLRHDRAWDHCQHGDGGVTSDLGFRVMLDADDTVRIVDATSGKKYGPISDFPRLQGRIRELELELPRLQQVSSKKT